MKRATLSLTGLLTAGALLGATSTAIAAEANAATTATGPVAAASTSATATTKSDAELQETASRIVGNINIATLGLSENMPADASEHIAAARKDIAALDGQMASYDSKAPVLAGKLSYKNAKGEGAYWIPVENDHFVIRTFHSTHIGSKNPDVDVTDAQMVHFKMVLNTKTADQELASAQTAIGQKHYDAALSALENISKAAITETTVAELPLETTRDNLILSRELLQDKDYRGASFALKHAETELSQVKDKTAAAADKADIAKMQSQIHTLQASITRQKPSLLKTTEMKIDSWIDDVKQKLHSV